MLGSEAWPQKGGKYDPHAVDKETAGEVWRFLMDHGESTLTAVEKGVEAPAGTVAMAVGWLAREGKVEVVQEKHSAYLWLTEI